jgi:hypothetical protein
MKRSTQNIRAFFYRHWWLYYLLFFLLLGVIIYILMSLFYTNERIVDLNRRFDNCDCRNRVEEVAKDSIDQRVIDNEGEQGCLSFTLVWNTTDDIDLEVIDPYREKIWYEQYCKGTDGEFSPSGGQLDIDLNAEGEDGEEQRELTDRPVENIYFKCTPPKGIYTANAVFFKKRNNSPVEITLRVSKNGKVVETVNKTITFEKQNVALIRYDYNGN